MKIPRNKIRTLFKYGKTPNRYLRTFLETTIEKKLKAKKLKAVKSLIGNKTLGSIVNLLGWISDLPARLSTALLHDLPAPTLGILLEICPPQYYSKFPGGLLSWMPRTSGLFLWAWRSKPHDSPYFSFTWESNEPLDWLTPTHCTEVCFDIWNL